MNLNELMVAVVADARHNGSEVDYHYNSPGLELTLNMDDGSTDYMVEYCDQLMEQVRDEADDDSMGAYVDAFWRVMNDRYKV